MAVLLPPMSAIPHIQHHMTATHGQSVPSPLPPTQTTAPKKPKLSLQTSSLTNIYASPSRGVMPNTSQTAYTPTTTNTLANTWDLAIRPSPISRTESPRPPQVVRITPPQQAYTVSLPFGIRSILKNSPIPPKAGSVSASPRDSRRKAFFPQPKKVAFRQDLEEIIETKQYVAKHSDIASSDDENSEDDQHQETSSLDGSDSAEIHATSSSPPCRKRKVRRDSGVFIETKQVPDSNANADDTTDTTPSSNCKRRKWQWASYTEGSPTKAEGDTLESNSKAKLCEDLDAKSLNDDQIRRADAPNEDDTNVNGCSRILDEASTSSPLAAAPKKAEILPDGTPELGQSAAAPSETGGQRNVPQDPDGTM